MKLDFAGIIVVLLLLIFLIYFLHSKSLDNFIIFVDDVIIPKSCYNYLLTNGEKYFLLNTKKMIDGVTNPLTFNTKQEAKNYLKESKCPTNIPFVDLVMRKKLEDPTVSYERQCNKIVSPNLFDIDVCGKYGADTDILQNKYRAKLNQIENDKKVFADYNVETCMMDKVMKENTDLDDANFKSYFSKYFDHVNSNIDEKFLYVTN
jgi:hypothetical protein